MLKFTSINKDSFNNDENLIQILELVNIHAIVISNLDEIDNKSQYDLFLINISSQSNIDYRNLKNYHTSDPPLIAIIHEDEINKIPLDLIPDNFIILPCSNQEIILRSIKLVNEYKKTKNDSIINIGSLEINVSNFEVLLNKIPITLRFKEYELLVLMASSPGKVFSRNMLLKKIWGYDYVGGSRTVDVHIRRLRSKLEKEETYIETVRPLGYRFKKYPT
tara:strand:+ start:22324 stop:22983 length:660 start_codon:yes stop_codon:yes gene_type:complete